MIDNNHSKEAFGNVSVAIPTYGRESILIETIQYILDLEPRPFEILVIDQT